MTDPRDNTSFREEWEKIDLMIYWRMFWKRRWLILEILAAVLAVVALKTIGATPIYTAVGTLLIENEAKVLAIEDSYSIALQGAEYAQTQYRLLQGYALAERAVGKLGLAEKAASDANAAALPVNGRPAQLVDAQDSALARRLAESLMSRIAVKPVRQTRLVDVEFRDPDPEHAALVVNTLLETFIDMNIEAKYASTDQTSEFLAKQIQAIRDEIDASEKQLLSYGAEKDIVLLSEKETAAVDTLRQLNQALTQATIDRVSKESYYNEIKEASAAYIAEARAALPARPAADPAARDVVQPSLEAFIRLMRDLQRPSGSNGHENPQTSPLAPEIESARRSLIAEANALIGAAYADLQLARNKEESLNAAFGLQKKEAERLYSSTITYYSLKNEIANKNSLLGSLMKQQSEMGVSARLRGLRTSNIKIADRARVPKSPSAPNKKKLLLMALFIGLVGGLGTAYFLEMLDTTIKTGEDVEQTANLPVLGIVPQFDIASFKKGYGYAYGYGYGYGEDGGKRATDQSEGEAGPAADGGGDSRPGAPAVEKTDHPSVRIELIPHHAPKSGFAESFRSIRTSVLLSSSAPGRKVFIITSALPAEGKSTVICNLAVTLAQDNRRVLVVDADLRKPRQHRIFGLKNVAGLTNCLISSTEIETAIKPTQIPNLYLFNSGPVPPNPAELLGSPRMSMLLQGLRTGFDVILIDSPPVLAVTDAQILAPRADGVILVVWSGKTPRQALKTARQKLDLPGIKTLGVVINHLHRVDQTYSYKRHRYRYREEGGDS